MAGKVLKLLVLITTFLEIFGTECLLCESLLDENDPCAFLMDESTNGEPWNCPPVFPCSPIIAINFTFLMGFRAIRLQKKIKCHKFIISTQNLTRYKEIFNGIDKFAPYSKIILLESGEDGPYEFAKDEIDIMYYNALHVVQVYQDPSEITLRVIISGATAVGTRESIPSLLSVLPRHQLHPLIDSQFSRNEINVSLYHCPPFVIDKNLSSLENDGTLNVRRFDGIEFRLLAYITRRWKRRFFVKREDEYAVDLATDVVMDLIEKRSEVALCGLWLIEELQKYLEVSHSYTQQCISLLVPRRPAISRDQYIYLALGPRVWLLYVILVLFVSLLIFFVVTHNTNDNIPYQFNILMQSIMQVITIATQHGITYFPRRYSAKVLIIAWTFFSFLIGAIYSTGYTSILTTSIFPPPISTIKHVLDRKLKWGDYGSHLQEELKRSGLAEYVEFSKYSIDRNSEEAHKLMNSVKYAQAVSVLAGNNIAGASNFGNTSINYRLMSSSNCIYNFNTIFAFQRNSAYTRYFNKEIPKFVESGLVIHWLRLYSSLYSENYVRTFYIQTKDIRGGPHILSFDNIAPGLYILGMGLCFATGVFIAELLYFKINTMERKQSMKFSKIQNRKVSLVEFTK